MERLKDKLLGTLGTFGFIIYQALALVCAFLPFLVVANHYIEPTWLIIVLFIAFYAFSTFLPVAGGIANIILWVWGMVLVIIAWPIWFAVIYAVFFIIFMAIFISALRSNRD